MCFVCVKKFLNPHALNPPFMNAAEDMKWQITQIPDMTISHSFQIVFFSYVILFSFTEFTVAPKSIGQ